MKLWQIILILLMMSPALSALTLAEIHFSEDFGASEAALLEASGLQIGTEYDPQVVSAAIQNLYAWLHARDQYYVRIPQPDLIPLSESQIALRFHASFALDSSQLKIRYRGLKYFSESKLHEYAYTSPEASYPLSELERIMQRVLELYHQRAFLFCSVKLDSLVADDGLTAWLAVDEGNIFRPEKYHFQGNNITRENTLLKSSGLLRQKLITPQILSQAEENIKSKEYIRDCSILPLDEDNLLFKIEEGRMTFLEGVLGFNESDGKRKLSGLVNIEFLNLWGTDRGIKLFWRKTPAEYSELSFSYHESGHHRLPLAADLKLERTLSDSTWIRTGLDLDLYYQSLYHRIGASFATRSILPGTSYSAIEKDYSSSIGAFWQYQNTKGSRIKTSGSRLAASYDYVLAKAKNYGNLQLSIKQYIPIKGRFIAYWGAEYKRSENRDLADYDLFFMGGYGSLRGYRQDEYQSHQLGWMNSELRYMINPETMLYIFYDHGFQSLANDDLKADLLALGTGIKLGTRLGILSIEYALGYRDKGFSSVGLGMIHLGLDIAL